MDINRINAQSSPAFYGKVGNQQTNNKSRGAKKPPAITKSDSVNAVNEIKIALRKEGLGDFIDLIV